MNQDQLIGLLRNAVSVGGGYAIGRGWLNGEQVTLLGGAIGTVVPLVWTYFAHTDAAKLSAAAAIPDVKKIVVSVNSNGPIKEAANDPAQSKITTGP